ncbi:RNA polymerase factor sigma-54, partial [Intestinibacillus massiliensis]
ADAAKRALRQLIAEEPPDAPLNDQQMAEALAAGLGLQISRRTVAKYRAELGIGGVHDRRRPG